jgi:branched-chain amino acid transport system substrate-binding protein
LAVVGPMTSQIAIAVVPEANRAQVPMISPTVSTNQLTGLDDYFLRLYYSNSQAAGLLAGHLADHRQRPRMVAIYDQSNSAYTEDWINAFRQNYERLGGTLLAAIPFDSRQGVPFGLLANQVFKEQPRGVLLLANALDTAMIAQQFAKQGAKLPLYATGWSYSDDLLQFGGASVEGLTIVQSADLNSQYPEYRAFRQGYMERFRDEPNFPALHAYDATRTVIAALTDVDADGTKLKAKLLALPATHRAQGMVAFDRFGDLRDPELHLATIEKGKFRSLR